MDTVNGKPISGNFKDLQDMEFERWTVLSFHSSTSDGSAKWLCRCKCGTERPVKAASLLAGRSSSCGCYHKDRVSKLVPKRQTTTPIVTSTSKLVDVPVGSLSCSKCKQIKPADEFGTDSRKKCQWRGSKRYKCKDCETTEAKQPHRRILSNQRSKEFLERLKTNDPDEYNRRIREQNLRKNYGLGQAEYQVMFDQQFGQCAICKKTDGGGRWNRMHIDHDHATGEVRGLLCQNCNIALGGFKDDITILENAITYLKQHQGT